MKKIFTFFTILFLSFNIFAEPNVKHTATVNYSNSDRELVTSYLVFKNIDHFIPGKKHTLARLTPGKYVSTEVESFKDMEVNETTTTFYWFIKTRTSLLFTPSILRYHAIVTVDNANKTVSALAYDVESATATVDKKSGKLDSDFKNADWHKPAISSETDIGERICKTFVSIIDASEKDFSKWEKEIKKIIEE